MAKIVSQSDNAPLDIRPFKNQHVMDTMSGGLNFRLCFETCLKLAKVALLPVLMLGSVTVGSINSCGVFRLCFESISYFIFIFRYI